MRHVVLAAASLLVALAIPGALPPASASVPAASAATGSAPAQRARDDAEEQARWFYSTLTGEIAARTGHPAQAYAELLRAARDMDSADLFERAIQVALDARQLQLALQAAAAWHEMQPASVRAQAWRVQLLLGIGGHDKEAAAATSRLLAMTPQPRRPQAILALGGVFEGMHDPARALALARRSLAPYAALPQTQVVLAHLQVLAGQVDAGVARAARALQADHGLRPAAMILLQHYTLGPQRADGLLQDYFAAQPDDDSLRMIWVDAATQQQRDSVALAQSQVLASHRPDFPQVWLIMGSLRQQLALPIEAQHDFERYLALSLPADSPQRALLRAPASASAPAAPLQPAPSADDLRSVYLALSAAALHDGDSERAQQWLQAIGAHAEDPAVVLQQAKVLAAQGRAQQAVQLVQHLPRGDRAQRQRRLLALADLLQAMHQPARALHALESGMAAWGGDAGYAYETAMAAGGAGRTARMEAILRRIVQAHPDYQPALNALGYTLADHGRELPKARQLIVRALRLSPGNPFVLDSLGWADFRLGHLGRAQASLQQAYAARRDPQIAAHLAQVLWRRGHHAQALALLRQAWQAAPKDPGVLRAMRRLGAKF